MPMVRVKYFASFRELLSNTREEEYEVRDGTMLMDLLLKHIPERHRNVSRGWKESIFEMDGDEIKFDKDGTPALRRYYMILVNGRYYNWIPKGLKYELKDGDVIAILLPVGGG